MSAEDRREWAAEVVEMEAAFRKHTIRRVRHGGRYSVRCRRGLWAVEGPDRESVDAEARHYFRQYYEDGEYER